MLPVNILSFKQSNHIYYSAFPIFPYPVSLNSFHYVLLCFFLHRFNVFQYYSLSFSSSSPPPLVSSNSLNIGNTFRIYIHVYIIMLLFVFGSIFCIWEKTCDLCLSEPALLHFTQCPPVLSTYLWPTKFHPSLWPNNILLCIYKYTYIHIYTYHISFYFVILYYFLKFISILELYWEYIVTFTKRLQYFLVRFTPSIFLLYPSSPLS
jgi:hypothetical protein